MLRPVAILRDAGYAGPQDEVRNGGFTASDYFPPITANP
jgi:hypothetical protein